jgi:hypothetical protein
MISFIGVLASSKGVSEISALGTITSATMKRRPAHMNRVSLAWWRNITAIPKDEARLVCLLRFELDDGRNRSPQGVLRFRAGGNCSSERRLGESLILRDAEVKRKIKECR